jgi:Glycosyl hydrolases family 2, TIM barrel domain
VRKCCPRTVLATPFTDAQPDRTILIPTHPHRAYRPSVPAGFSLTAWLLAFLCLLIGCDGLYAGDTGRPGSVVAVVETSKGWELRRNGEPYFIRGAGGQGHLETLVDVGGNSIRTWGADRAGEVLDLAQELGLTVTVGIWLEHERHGFDYSDDQAVSRQLQEARRVVELYKDHPALLMWGLGNEVEGDGKNPLVFKAINDVARMVKGVDPDHPTMAVFAEIGGNKIESLRRYCPDIDVLGVNSYGGLASLGERLSRAGLDRPYVVTEFGPLGQWEIDQTRWGAPIEQNSTQKAEFCARGYKRSIAGQPGRCLGGYVFVWGNKQEVTPTWYSLFPDDASRTETVDVMTRFWTGSWPKNRVPSIERIDLDGGPDHLKAGAEYRARVTATDREGDALDIRWVVRSESTDRGAGGDFEKTPSAHPQALISSNGPDVVFKAPDGPGGYRLFVYVYDGHGGVATGNIPFYLDP